MTAVARLKHRFVKNAPRHLSPSVLYISVEYCTMLHLCACGCGRKVVTPLSPNDWSMAFNGKTVTVHPSIGSWSLPCQSHYFIKRGEVVWAGQWSEQQIQRGRETNLIHKRGKQSENFGTQEAPPLADVESGKSTWFQTLFNWITRQLR